MIEQGSAEWFALRAGKVTASRVADVIAKTKTGPSALRQNYLAQLVAERLTGTVADSYSNEAMKWGTEKEPDARSAYEFYSVAPVMPAGFVVHPVIGMSGASPDGYVGEAGLIEIKCPNTATHIETLLGATVPGKYITQMQWQMACTGRAWCDFVSYDPRMPEDMRLFVKRVARNDEIIDELEVAVRVFLSDVAATVVQLEKLYRMEAA